MAEGTFTHRFLIPTWGINSPHQNVANTINNILIQKWFQLLNAPSHEIMELGLRRSWTFTWTGWVSYRKDLRPERSLEGGTPGTQLSFKTDMFAPVPTTQANLSRITNLLLIIDFHTIELEGLILQARNELSIFEPGHWLTRHPDSLKTPNKMDRKGLVLGFAVRKTQSTTRDRASNFRPGYWGPRFTVLQGFSWPKKSSAQRTSTWANIGRDERMSYPVNGDRRTDMDRHVESKFSHHQERE